MNTNRRINTMGVAIVAALATTLASRDADAFRYWKCWTGAKLNWSSDHKTFDADADAFPPGGGRHAAVTRAMEAINDAPSQASVSLHTDPDELVGFGNLESEIYFVSDMDAVAACKWQADLAFSCYLTEADVRINAQDWADGKFSTGQSKSPHTKYGNGPRLLETTMIHELGHCMGLQHEDRVYSSMGESFGHLHTNGDKTAGYAGVDTTKGLRFLYGSANDGENLAITHWKWIGSTNPGCNGGNDCYSKHGRTVMMKSGGDTYATTPDLKNTTTDEEPYYKVIRGQEVLVEFGYENLGASDQSTLVQFVVSEDDQITSADTAVDGLPLPLTLSKVSNSYRSDGITIPTNIPSGKRWVGAIIDPAGDLAETDETDNATYVGIEVIDPTKPSLLTQNLPQGGTRQLVTNPANGWATMDPVVLSAKVGGYTGDFSVPKCRVNFYLTGGAAPTSLANPSYSSAFAAPASTVSVTVPVLSPGSYKWFAATQCENDSLGYGSDFKAKSTAAANFHVTAPVVDGTPTPPVQPFALTQAVYPKSVKDKLWVDAEIELGATSFDLNNDGLRMEFAVVQTKDENGNAIAPKVTASKFMPYKTASYAALSLNVTQKFQFYVDAGTYTWSVRACDDGAPSLCSVIVVGGTFEVSNGALENSCDPMFGYCDWMKPGFFFGAIPEPVNPPDPTPWITPLNILPIDVFTAIAQTGNRARGTAMLTGTLIRNRGGDVMIVDAQTEGYAPDAVTGPRTALRHYGAFEQQRGRTPDRRGR